MTPQITPNRYSIGTLPFASVTIPWKSRQKKKYIYIYTVNFHPFFWGLAIPLHWIHYPSLGGLSLTSNRRDQDAKARRFITSSSPSATADTEERKGRTKSFRGPKSSKVRGNKAKKSCLYFWAKQKIVEETPMLCNFSRKILRGGGLVPDKNFQVANCGNYFLSILGVLDHGGLFEGFGFFRWKISSLHHLTLQKLTFFFSRGQGVG